MPSPILVAKPYAEAVFSLSVEDGTADRWSAMLALMADIAAVPEMAAAIASPLVDRAVILDILLQAGGEGLDRLGRNLLRVLAENGRFALLATIAEHYEALRAERERRGVVRVITARPLSPQHRRKLEASLEASLARAVTLDCAIDERLLGGAVIRFGDRVLDASVTGRLNELGNQLA